MAIEIIIHDDLSHTLAELSRELSEFDGEAFVANLTSDFERYIGSDKSEAPSYFGRDAPYMQPHQASRAMLCHLHVHLPPGAFKHRQAQQYQTSDTFIVYCQHELYESKVLIIDILHPDAHTKSKDKKRMLYLAHIAQCFQEQF
ncbi:type II toxin-antitoxin system YafO family toxin [Halomonas sp. IOP_14]|uniref:type II toxin-antitoxin system YafO family toxin n=1 Tax=Halomonas sp. IOP_14 TaxID=2873295 RepID=UPI001E43110A|nr:type II toxin-antitoxin system YafO family toxin [Halomonas sp. IOP_14]MCD1588152.1 type II toxin-antitoxin system YafO family toxin [Halomonas sp. IOP_14]